MLEKGRAAFSVVEHGCDSMRNFLNWNRTYNAGVCRSSYLSQSVDIEVSVTTCFLEGDTTHILVNLTPFGYLGMEGVHGTVR